MFLSKGKDGGKGGGEKPCTLMSGYMGCYSNL